MTSPHTHSLPIRVYYEDTDAGGIVYHASYLRFAERGRTEMLRDGGFEHADLFKEQGVAFAVVNLAVNYKSPAKLDALLVVKTHISRLGGASMDMQQDIYRSNDLICEIKVTLVCIDQSLKAVRLPQVVRDLFKSEV
ncbi:MAG TPA: tol-pal system-associated acyl-CoA thioesterase [Alphaproteobacteria bacterium]|nr:tol-pal system-associated acyl-CoA thioesterase [Alphaproteobacteria bacterium]